jgi:tetratricopeptide (TPR) repeat protein
MRQLAGLQYYNESVSHVQDVAYEKALNSALKASVVYPSERIDFLITSILAELLNMGTAYNMKQIKYINIFSETPSSDSNRISANLDHMFHKHIIKDGNLAFADSAYEYLTTHLSSPFLVNRIKEFYHTYYSYYYYETGEGMKGLPHAKLAYVQNNKNVQLQSLIYSLVINDLRSKGANNEHGYLKELNAYTRSFPFLLNRKDFQRIKVYAVATTAYDEFADKQLTPGLSLLDTLDRLIKLYPTEKSDQKANIVRAFGKGSMLYYKRGQYYKALEVVQRGLAYYPKDPYLLERKSYILREL